MVAPAFVERLRCEYRENPLGIDVQIPRLSWITRTDRRAFVQTAYRVLVADTLESLANNCGNLWDSGEIVSNASIQIEYAGSPLQSRQCCFWKVQIWDGEKKASDWSPAAFWTMGLLNSTDWLASWIGLEKSTHDLPSAVPRYLRNEFHLTRPIRRAVVYASALGLYELHLNGSRVGDHLLAPEWTDYTKRVQYQTYDVTHLLVEGQNAIAGLLGNGWYCGDWQFWESKLRPIYGEIPWLLVQMEIEYDDASVDIVSTDARWRGTSEGPLRFSGIYEGETYDSTKEMPGWDKIFFDDINWFPVTKCRPNIGKIVWQRSEPIRVTQELIPISISQPKEGVYVLDFGQNIAGWCRFQINEAANTVLEFKFNEVLHSDGTVYMDNLHSGNLSKGPRQLIRYICNGHAQTYEPYFTYQGFRYVEVSGLRAQPNLDFLTGLVFHTSFEKAGHFSCSDPLLTKLADNIQWSQRANIMGIPTDCCQRDERCGYTGDMNFFMPTAIYNFDMAAFFSKWLADLCQDSQLADGHFADHAPTYGPGNGWNVGWSDAGIICPYLMYRTYGDTRVIKEHYSAMQLNMEAQIKTAHPSGIRGPEIVGNGDWLNLGGGAAKEVIGTAYFAYDLKLMSEMAAAIGETQDAEKYDALSAQIGDAFMSQLVDEEGRIKDSSQTGYALAFTMGLVAPDKKDLMSLRFAEEIEYFDGHLATGFIGTPRLLTGLHLAGRDDLAEKLLLTKTFPSWLYPITLGATTVWERWNGWTPDNGFADSGMNSFNHYAFGAVGEFLFSKIGGIREVTPGYQSFCIHPILCNELTWAEASFFSPYGLIKSNWKKENETFTLEIKIPPNCHASICIPKSEDMSVTEGGNYIKSPDVIQFSAHGNSHITFELNSGNYKITSLSALHSN